MRRRATTHASHFASSFNSRTPCGVRHATAQRRVRLGSRFNSRTPCGVRQTQHIVVQPYCGFNSRTPCGVRLNSGLDRTRYDLFQFTHPVWGATGRHGSKQNTPHVSIHAPRVGCDTRQVTTSRQGYGFQFTHPVWGATFGSATSISVECCFNSRTPCGVRPISF